MVHEWLDKYLSHLAVTYLNRINEHNAVSSFRPSMTKQRGSDCLVQSSEIEMFGEQNTFKKRENDLEVAATIDELL